MQYRKMAGEKVSALGFGCMRFPVIDNDPEKIDEELATRMMNYAVEHGVNYFDTAWPYHREQSEPFVGRYLKENNLRDKIQLATKLPSWYIKTPEDCEKYLTDQLSRLQTDHIDFYLVHALSTKLWEQVLNAGIIEFLDRIKKDGRATHVGFSFHDDQDAYFPIADGYEWEFTQILVNYMDDDFQAGKKGFEYAASKGMDIIAMEPLRGGKLTKSLPPEIQAELDKSGLERTPAELALRWVWNKPEVSTALSGMSNFEQVVENCKTVETALPNALSCEEMDVIEKLKTLYRERTVVPCTDCRYCLPCPSGVAVPQIFNLYNDFHIYTDEGSPRIGYRLFVNDDAKADKCAECGECEEKCPQQIEIIKSLKDAHATLASE